MSHLVGVLLNGVAQLEYDRDKPLPDHQAAYLVKMDSRMDEGIVVDGESVAEPSLDQRARFVSANLVHAIKSSDEAKAAALCTYLADRLPDLKQVKILEDQGEISVELVFDEDYKKQVAVAPPKLH